jgi:hypothetical protein
LSFKHRLTDKVLRSDQLDFVALTVQFKNQGIVEFRIGVFNMFIQHKRPPNKYWRMKNTIAGLAIAGTIKGVNLFVIPIR